jgi:hypothetical protein
MNPYRALISAISDILGEGGESSCGSIVASGLEYQKYSYAVFLASKPAYKSLKQEKRLKIRSGIAVYRAIPQTSLAGQITC